MKLADNPPKVTDEVIAEVRAIKRTISKRYGNDIDRLLDALMVQEGSRSNAKAEQDGIGQPATRPEPKSKGGDKPQPDSEGRSR